MTDVSNIVIHQVRGGVVFNTSARMQYFTICDAIKCFNFQMHSVTTTFIVGSLTSDGLLVSTYMSYPPN